MYSLHIRIIVHVHYFQLCFIQLIKISRAVLYGKKKKRKGKKEGRKRKSSAVAQEISLPRGTSGYWNCPAYIPCNKTAHRILASDVFSLRRIVSFSCGLVNRIMVAGRYTEPKRTRWLTAPLLRLPGLFSLYGAAIGRRDRKRNYKYAAVHKTELSPRGAVVSCLFFSFLLSFPFLSFPPWGTHAPHSTPTNIGAAAGVRITLTVAIIIRYF